MSDLIVEDLRLRFGDHDILKGVSLTVPRGRITATFELQKSTGRYRSTIEPEFAAHPSPGALAASRRPRARRSGPWPAAR